MQKWLTQQSNDIYAAGFDALVKRWDSVSVLVEDMSRNTCSFFPGSNIAFYVLYPFVTHLQTLPRKKPCLGEETSRRTDLVSALMRHIMADDK
jgi:hypothetical protein